MDEKLKNTVLKCKKEIEEYYEYLNNSTKALSKETLLKICVVNGIISTAGIYKANILSLLLEDEKPKNEDVVAAVMMIHKYADDYLGKVGFDERETENGKND